MMQLVLSLSIQQKGTDQLNYLAAFMHLFSYFMSQLGVSIASK